MKSLGLDLSLSGTGMVGMSRERGSPLEFGFQELFKAADNTDRWERVDDLASAILARIYEYGPDVITIEGYGQGLHRNVQSFVKVVELSTLVKHQLWSQGYAPVDVPPNSLKLFTAGVGNATKAQMIKAVWKEWGLVTKNDNIADAGALAALGLARRGMLHPLRPHQQEALANLKVL